MSSKLRDCHKDKHTIFFYTSKKSALHIEAKENGNVSQFACVKLRGAAYMVVLSLSPTLLHIISEEVNAQYSHSHTVCVEAININ